MRAICTENHRLPRDSPPWKWGPFWANVAKLGLENGTRFGDGLLRAADVEGGELNLSGQLDGDRPTVLAVVCALMGSLRVLDLSSNGLGPKECVTIAKALYPVESLDLSLRVLDLSDNKLGPKGGATVAKAIKRNSTLTSLNLLANNFDVKTVQMLLKVKEEKPSLTTLCGIKPSQTQVDLSNLGLEPADAKLFLPEIAVSGSLTNLDVSSNNITGDAAQQLAEAVLSKHNLEVFCKIPLKELRADKLINLDLRGKGIGVPGALVLAELLRTVSGSLTNLEYVLPTQSSATSVHVSAHNISATHRARQRPALRERHTMSALTTSARLATKTGPHQLCPNPHK